MTQKYSFETIFIHPLVTSNPVTQKIIKNYPDIPVIITEKPTIDIQNRRKETVSADVTNNKRNLWITKQEGKFLHRCPGTPGMVCCNYYVVDLIENCPLNCTYCFLQGYLNTGPITLYVNSEDLFNEVENLRKALPHELLRIGTGELSDSLALENVTEITSQLIPFFVKQKNILLELKTKTTNIENLRQFQPDGKVVIAWSVNPDSIIKSEEYNSATLSERLEAARQCQSWGYKVAFHFDPMFDFPGWETAYGDVVDALFSYVSPDTITWISLGTFRYFSNLKEIIKERFPKTPIIYGEHHPGADGKMRYLRLLRERMYQTVYKRIRMHAPELPVYLCMESAQVWRNVFGWVPECEKNWSDYFQKGLQKEQKNNKLPEIG
ncbi:MAG: hypothetical protein M1426_03990, partial [Patescibacteria group bacterium]|nr:hypothetical protein [Patescibacteria group bacterium]